MRRHAEIAGAGFAGLTAACALAQRGWSVRVHERGQRLRTTGAGIYIYENGLRVLEALGAYAEAVKGAPIAHTREVRDDRNRVVSRHRWDSSSRVFSIVRQQVINALAAAPTRVVIAVGEESQDTFTARASDATAELLGQRATVFPSHHGGFLGDEFGQPGEPEAFAALLHQVLDAG